MEAETMYLEHRAPRDVYEDSKPRLTPEEEWEIGEARWELEDGR